MEVEKADKWKHPNSQHATSSAKRRMSAIVPTGGGGFAWSSTTVFPYERVAKVTAAAKQFTRMIPPSRNYNSPRYLKILLLRNCGAGGDKCDMGVWKDLIASEVLKSGSFAGPKSILAANVFTTRRSLEPSDNTQMKLLYGAPHSSLIRVLFDGSNDLLVVKTFVARIDFGPAQVADYITSLALKPVN